MKKFITIIAISAVSAPSVFAFDPPTPVPVPEAVSTFGALAAGLLGVVLARFLAKRNKK